MAAKIIGCGGCGNHMVNYLANSGLGRANYLVLHRDAEKIQEETDIPTIITDEIPENVWEIFLKGLLVDARPCFILCGLGGKSGSKLALELTEAANRLNIRPFVLATTPFEFESPKRKAAAEEAIAQFQLLNCGLHIISNSELSEQVNSLGQIGAFAAIYKRFYQIISDKITPVVYTFK